MGFGSTTKVLAERMPKYYRSAAWLSARDLIHMNEMLDKIKEQTAQGPLLLTTAKGLRLAFSATPWTFKEFGRAVWPSGH